MEKCRAKRRCFRRSSFRRNAKANSFPEMRRGLSFYKIRPRGVGAVLSLQKGPVQQDQRVSRQFRRPNGQFLPYHFTGIDVIKQQDRDRTICEIGYCFE